MATNVKTKSIENVKAMFPLHGWLGLSLIIIFWALNWTLTGPRTHWAFFPLWLGYCLAIDGLVYWRTGISLFTRSPRRYVGLFLVSAPVWWLFELFNLRTQNWVYIGAEILRRSNMPFGQPLASQQLSPPCLEALNSSPALTLLNASKADL